MILETERFGKIELEESGIITFEQGIIGFEDLGRFVIIDYLEDSSLKWLQAIDDPKIAFVVCDPWTFFEDYDPRIEKEEKEEIGLAAGDAVTILCIVTVPKDISKTSLNLLSPIIINQKKMKAKQIILYNSDYRSKHEIFKTIKLKEKLKDQKAEKTG
jgi:flagellar assembly factor FliW